MSNSSLNKQLHTTYICYCLNCEHLDLMMRHKLKNGHFCLNTACYVSAQMAYQSWYPVKNIYPYNYELLKNSHFE